MVAANSCILAVSSVDEMGHTYAFERDYNYSAVSGFMNQHFPKAFVLVTIYVVAIHTGQRYMRNRPAFRLRGPLFFWNVMLAAYSAFGFSRVFIEMVRLLRLHGFHTTICDLHDINHANFLVMWSAIMVMSKVVELGDTLFIVLRKAPLLFLHWYHHVVTLLFVWYSVTLVNALGAWFMTINLFVHSIMYSYYALKVLGVKVPARVSMSITILQLMQMIAGIFMSVYAFRMKVRGVMCCTDDRIIAFAWVMYLSYFLLFLNFFVRSYLGKRARTMENHALKKAA